MKFSHREEKRGERLLDFLTDEERGLRIVVSRLGAEMISIARRDRNGSWIGFLHRDDDLSKPEKGWANHATVMGYFLHRLKDERSIYRGREIRGGTHSFLRTKTWRLMETPGDDGVTLTYGITPKDFTAVEYPLNVSLTLSYTLEVEKIRVSFRFQNDEPELTAHLGFGLHPGFAVGALDGVSFKMPAGRYRRHFSPENYLSGETQEIDFAGGEMPFDKGQLPGSFILELVDVPERQFIFSDPPTGRVVQLDLTGVPYLTLWSDGGAFLCVEPCWGLTDHHEQRAFEEKEGIQKIEPGAELIAGFTIESRLT